MPNTTIITGASSGIGRELAIQLAPEGGTFYLLGQNSDRLEEVAARVEKQGGTAHAHPCDVTEFEAIEAWYEGLRKDGVEVDSVYCCAGRNTFGEVLELSMDDLEWVYRTNLLAASHWVSMIYPDMANRGQGRIVLLSSLSAFSGFPMATPYAASKQALIAMGRSIWPEAEELGIDLQIVCPGFVDTRIFEASRFRDCDLDGVMDCIKQLGFPIMPVDRAVEKMLKELRKGKRLIVFPFYAKFMAFLGYRMPWLIDIFHRRVIRDLHRRAAQPSTNK